MAGTRVLWLPPSEVVTVALMTGALLTFHTASNVNYNHTSDVDCT